MLKYNIITTGVILSMASLAYGDNLNREGLKADKKHPNVIYIYADDLGMGILSANGQKHFTTPNIDKLIHQGTYCERAYGCMLSAPARASLLTGYHDCHGEDKWNISPGGMIHKSQKHATDTTSLTSLEARINAKDVRLPDGDLYLPQVFRKAGYHTGQIGKLEYGFTATREQMRFHGWDYYYGYLDHQRCHGYYPPFLFENGTIDFIKGNTHINCGLKSTFENREGVSVYSQDIFDIKIVNYLHEHKNERFFLFHPSQLPHGYAMIPSIHPELAANPNLNQIERIYGSMVKKLDHTVGLILAELKELQIDDRTIVVFAADNGHELYYCTPGRCEKYHEVNTDKKFDNLDCKFRTENSGDVFNGNAGMAGIKRTNLEGGVHIPLTYYCPGIIPKGKRMQTLISNYDFLSTMADLLEVEVQGKDGKSYLQQLVSDNKREPHAYIVFGSNSGPGIVMADGWKLRHYLQKNTLELFYLPDDPEERHDLSKKYPEKVKELNTVLLKECDGDLRRGVNQAG